MLGFSNVPVFLCHSVYAGYFTKLLTYVAQTEWRWWRGERRMSADSSGSKLTCACVETKKEDKLKGNKWPNLEDSKSVTTWCVVRSILAIRGASICTRTA